MLLVVAQAFTQKSVEQLEVLQEVVLSEVSNWMTFITEKNREMNIVLPTKKDSRNRKINS